MGKSALGPVRSSSRLPLIYVDARIDQESVFWCFRAIGEVLLSIFAPQKSVVFVSPFSRFLNSVSDILMFRTVERKKTEKLVASIIVHILLMILDVVTRVSKVLLIPFQNIKKIVKWLINRWENWYFVRDLGKFWANTWILTENSSNGMYYCTKAFGNYWIFTF